MGALPSQKYEHVLLAFCFYLDEEHGAIVSFDDIGYEFLVKDFLRRCNDGEIDVR